jgi:hypothetical protein
MHNVFDGTPNTRVAYEIPGPARELDVDGHTPGADDPPSSAILGAFARYAKALSPWAQPLPSSHVWTAELGLLPGTLGIIAWAWDQSDGLRTACAILEFGGGGGGCRAARTQSAHGH